MAAGRESPQEFRPSTQSEPSLWEHDSYCLLSFSGSIIEQRASTQSRAYILVNVNTSAMHEVLALSQEGKLIFPEVVRRLLEAGVESYFADLAKGEETFYMPDGATHVEKMILPSTAIAEAFSSSGIVSAIRAAQADTIRYPEFMKRAAAAGIIGYWAFLTGKKVIYFGRKGEFHVEEFPRP
jgi:uncharacterized protein YbcV (DUF1398 family)